MPYSPADICNEAFDLIGVEPIGGLESGDARAELARRHYGPTLRMVLRAAPWNFARKAAPLSLLQDRTGQTPHVGTNPPLPWTYEYGWPIDCLRLRFLPLSQTTLTTGSPAGNIAISALPTAPVPVATPLPLPTAGARYAIGYDDSLPPIVVGDPTASGAAPAAQWDRVEGQGPFGRRVVLTNAPPPASAVYTALVLVPELWEPDFREAFAATLAAKFVVPALAFKHPGAQFADIDIAGKAATRAEDSQLLRLAYASRAQFSQAARDRVMAARAADANEGMNRMDRVPDWIRARRQGGRFWPGAEYGNGLLPSGSLYCGWDAVTWPDGNNY